MNGLITVFIGGVAIGLMLVYLATHRKHPQKDYVKTRRSLFAGKDVSALAEEARKFNRE